MKKDEILSQHIEALRAVHDLGSNEATFLKRHVIDIHAIYGLIVIRGNISEDDRQLMQAIADNIGYECVKKLDT